MKKQLKRVGFFRELPYGTPEGLSITSSSSEFPSDEKSSIVSYLSSGIAIAVSPGLSRDVISSDRSIIGSLALLTDGVFLWPSDLAYYVDKYSVNIPDEFLDWMERSAWVVPSDIDISELEM